MVPLILIGENSLTLTQPDGTKSAGSGTFRPDIEGLRAIAVLVVVLFHAGLPGVGGGYIGVDVFFVISGFLITGLLWREVASSGRVRLGRFYAARARRLLPASAVVGVATAIGSAVLLDPLEARQVLLDAISCALYVGNYGFAMQGTDYLAAAVPPSPFQHYWSLGVEEQFYLVWAPLILGVAWLSCRATRRPYLAVLALVGVASFAASLVLTHAAPSWAFFSLPTRAWELAAGGLVALTVQQCQRMPAPVAAIVGWAGLLLILTGCHLLGTGTQYPGTAALSPVVGTTSVIAAGCAATPFGVGRILQLASMRAIGRLSYSWYLWHWPALLLAPHLFGHPLGLAARLLAAGTSGLFAVLTLYTVENPLRFWSPVRDSVGRSLALGGVATAIALSAGLILLLVVPAPVGHGPAAAELRVTATPPPPGSDPAAYDAAVWDTYADVHRAVVAAVDVEAVPANLNPPLAEASGDRAAIVVNGCLLAYDEVSQGECVSGDAGSATTIAVVGDSHATMWSPAFRHEADQRHWRLETLGKEACPLMDLPPTYPRLHRPYTECQQWRGRILDRLRREHPSLVVLGMNRLYTAGYGFTPFDATWLTSLARLTGQLRADGAQVLVLGPVPDPRSIVPNCLSAHLDDATACSPLRSVAVSGSGISAEAAVTETSGGHYADVTELFCATDRCPAIVGNTLVYRDDNHVMLQYTRLLAPVFGALVDRTLADGMSRHE